MLSDVGPLELVTVAALAVLLFGPDKLPEMIQNVVEFLRKVREFSESAKDEIRSGLGPEFKDFEFEDLHPKTFVRKPVLDGDRLPLDEIRSALDPKLELDQVAGVVREAADETRVSGRDARRVPLAKSAEAEPSVARPTFDPDAT